MDWDRIENSVSSGMPDLVGSVNYSCGDNICCLDFWLELKVSQTKSVKGSLWKPTQVAWQTRAARRGRKVYNLVHRPLSSVPYELYHGRDLLTLVTEGPGAVTSVWSGDDLSACIDSIIVQESKI